MKQQCLKGNEWDDGGGGDGDGGGGGDDDDIDECTCKRVAEARVREF